MQVTTHDIAQRRERDGRMTTWVSERLLIEELGISEKYLWKEARPSFVASVSKAKRSKDILPITGKSWRYAKLNGAFYYDYDFLPTGRRTALPGKDELVQMATAKCNEDYHNHLKREVEAILKNGYTQYLHLYRGYNDELAHTLARGCAVIEFAADTLRSGGAESATAFFQDLANVLNLIGCPYLPKHWRRLKEKVDPLLEGEAVNHIIKVKREGNQNATKFDDPEIGAWLLQMRALPQNYTGAFIVRKIRLMCELAEKKVPSKSWLEQRLASHETKFLTTGRFGSGKLSDRWTGYIPVQNALHAGDCWMMDGTRVNMISYRDENGKECFLYWIATYDVHSGDILGVHFDTKEDRWSYVNALKMAVAHAGYLPYELVVDRFPGHNTEEIGLLFKRLERLGVTVTITSEKTGKAKLERTFETIQSVFMAESDWYYGEGVQSGRESAHRSPEYLTAQYKKRKDGAWNFDEAYTEMLRIVELYRTTKLSEYSHKFAQVQHSPSELHTMSDKPHAKKVEVWDTLELFGNEKTVSIRNGGLIKTEIQRVEYIYQVQEYTTIAAHKSVRLCYDMDDLSEVHLFADTDDINRPYLGTATEQRLVVRYGPDKDEDAISANMERIASLEKRRKAHFKALTEVADTDDGDMGHLLAGLAPKPLKQSAEAAWMEERAGEWKDTKGKPRIVSTSDADELEDEDMVLVPVRGNTARRQY
jgi:hypothetical protein